MRGAITTAAPRTALPSRLALSALSLVLGAIAGGAACRPPPARRSLPVAPLAVAPAPSRLPAWTYWEPVEAPVVPGAPTATLPVDLDLLTRTPSADARWAAAPPALRDSVRTRGFAVMRPARPVTRVGDLYASLRDDRVPWVITLDALFFVAHLAMDRALAEVEDLVIGPSLLVLLKRLDARLTTSSRGATADMASALLVARGVVAVGLALLQPGYRPPRELELFVLGEMSRVLSHSALGISPWLGVPLDYSAMSPSGQADRDESHASAFRAMAWLQGAALALEGRGEDDVGMPVDIATARTHARAALLLSRVVQHDVDAEAASAWGRIARAGDLLVGDPDDVTPRDLQTAASAAHLDLASASWLSSVTSVDRVRRTAARAHPARLDDGAGGAYAAATGLDPRRPLALIAPTFRLLAPRFTPDSELLQSMVFPVVGLLSSAEPPRSSRDGRRALPSALDVAAWLGSAEARAALHDSGDDAYSRYDETLDWLVSRRPLPGAIERHRTPYLSALDTLQAWLSPSVGDAVQPGAGSPAFRSRKAAVALAAWTELRHDAVPMARAALADLRLPPRAARDTPVPIFVEPHPEAIAGLLALVRQTERALVADGAISPAGPAVVVLEEAQDLLWDALGVAVHEASDQPVPAALRASMAAFPARLSALEAALGDAGGADVRLAACVHTDPSSGTALEETTGSVEELWVAMREPATHRLWLALGASVPHFERVEPMAQRLSDSGWAARVTDEQPPPEPLERAYFVDSK